MNLVVVSNRLPFAVARRDDGSWDLEPGSGGLVRALRPVLQNRGGRWIGWTGATEEELPDAGELLRDSDRAFGYFLESILRHGGTEPTVTETRCQCLGDSTCTFEMTWQ